MRLSSGIYKERGGNKLSKFYINFHSQEGNKSIPKDSPEKKKKKIAQGRGRE